ncbi:mechanosensitive ion channel family protein [Psychrobacter urativorans]|uniref:mechanosensitive ion channel family protein n=1 Tax=Psychrobacter urativorans TaxID=45610 RepID=UPI0019189413|nr:mechanosensitive ion channel family protein [Psychrobacter urativorans]
MAAYFDLLLLYRRLSKQLYRALLVWGQILLLNVISGVPAHAVPDAASAALADTTTALGLPNAAATTTGKDAPADDASADISAAADASEAPADGDTISSAPAPIAPIVPPSVISGESTNNAQIETTPTPKKDNDIRQRISGIFSEIEGLQAINVSVTQGVVSLTGETPNEKKAQQAIDLTNRLTDVVTVEDKINRTLDVQDNVTTVYQGLKTQGKTLIKALPLLLIGIVVFGVVVWFGSWLSNRQKMWQRLTPNPFVAELLSQTVKVIFIVFGLILALSLVGAETILGTLLGGAGVIGIAVGFAVKDTIENYIASLMLSIRQPFRARDQIAINGQEGIVVRLTSRATILMTFDGNQLRIPNAEVFKSTILNYTKNPERRFTFELGVDANDDPLAAIKVGIDAICTLDFVLDTPKTIAIITEVGDSNILLEFQVWVNQSETDFAKARSIAIRETKHALENEGFSLPEPIYRLRFNHKLEKVLGHMQNGNLASKSSAEITREPMMPAEEGEADLNEITVDDKDKKIAKARAKHILQGPNADDVLDARPDEKLMEKVEQEIAESSDETDLLDKNSPQE